jgi:hypothetical protein
MTGGRFVYDDLQGHIRNECGDIVGYTDDGLIALDQHGAANKNGAGPGPQGIHDEDELEGAGTSRLGVVLTRSQLSSLPAVETLIERVVGFPAAVLVVGSTGVGKTFCVVAFGCCVATGRSWLGHRVVRRRVLLVVGEGAYGLDQRVSAWEQEWNNGVSVPDEWLTIIVKPRSLHDPATWAELAAYAVAGGYGLVVLDTFSSLAPDSDETKDAAQIMRRLSDLATVINGTAMLIHHPGWSDSGRARGGSQLEANADEILILKEVTEGSDLFTMTRKKVKDGPAGEVHWLRRSLSHNSVIIEGSRSDDVSVPLRARIVAVLTNYGCIGATGRQIMDEIGVDDKARSGFYQAMRKLKATGAVREQTKGATTRYYIVPEDPQDPPLSGCAA